MEMISHHHKGMQEPMVAFARFKQAGLKGSPGPFFPKNPMTEIPSIHHMVLRPRVL